MQALIIVDAQNEFSTEGKRPVENFNQVVQVISLRVKEARTKGKPIAWVRHFNKPTEDPAFIPNSWGSEFIPGMGPLKDSVQEKEFQKDVYGAFTGSTIGKWLDVAGITEVVIVGFYTHGCVSTTAREAIMRDYSVLIDPEATSSFAMKNEFLGNFTAEEVHKSAIMHLVNMGAKLSFSAPITQVLKSSTLENEN